MDNWFDVNPTYFIELTSDVVSWTMNNETLAGTKATWDVIGRPWSLAKLLTLFQVLRTIVRRSQTGKIQYGRLMVAANRCTLSMTAAHPSEIRSLASPSLSTRNRDVARDRGPNFLIFALRSQPLWKGARSPEYRADVRDPSCGLKSS